MSDMRRITETTLGVRVEGQKIKMENIEGADVEIHRVGFSTTEMGPAVTVVVKNGETWAWFTAISRLVVEALEAAKDDLPVIGRFTSAKSANDRTYWTVE